MNALGIDCDGIYRDLIDLIGSELVESLYLKGKGKMENKNQRHPNVPIWKKYSRDLTQWAKEGKLIPSSDEKRKFLERCRSLSPDQKQSLFDWRSRRWKNSSGRGISAAAF